MAFLVIFAASTAHVGFVNFNDASQWPVALLHHKADLLAYAPGSFVSDAKCTLKFFAANPIPTDAEYIHRLEPFLQWRFRFMEDGIS